jgi:adenine-specific DNA methylase
MYNWHKFWGRKTWNVVSEFVETYCPEGGVVMDPFSGSGVTALEALKLGRRVIAVDLNPVATEILRLTIQPVDLVKLEEAFRSVEKEGQG